MGRSFRTSNERELIRFGAKTARVHLHVQAGGADHTTEVVLQSERPEVGAPRRHQRDAPARRRSTFLRVRVCSRTASSSSRVRRRRAVRASTTSRRRSGPPAARRALRTPRRLRSATRLLGRVRARAVGPDSLQVWDRELARHGLELMEHRRELVEALTGPFVERAAELGLAAPVSIAYRPRSSAQHGRRARGGAARAPRLRPRPRLHHARAPSRRPGPASGRGRDLRRYGSQGQQRLGLLSLLLAERDVLRNAPRQQPVDAARRRAQRARPGAAGAAARDARPIAARPSSRPPIAARCRRPRTSSWLPVRPATADVAAGTRGGDRVEPPRPARWPTSCRA